MALELAAAGARIAGMLDKEPFIPVDIEAE